MLAESLFLRRIYGRAEEGGFQILLTYSFILVIDDLVKLVWGTEYKSLQRPPGFSGSIEIAGLTIPSYNVAIIVIGLVVVIAGVVDTDPHTRRPYCPSSGARPRNAEFYGC